MYETNLSDPCCLQTELIDDWDYQLGKFAIRCPGKGETIPVRCVKQLGDFTGVYII